MRRPGREVEVVQSMAKFHYLSLDSFLEYDCRAGSDIALVFLTSSFVSCCSLQIVIRIYV